LVKCVIHAVGSTLSKLLKKLIAVKNILLSENTQKYVEKHNPNGIGSSKAFEVPPITDVVPDILSHAYRNTISTRYITSHCII